MMRIGSIAFIGLAMVAAVHSQTPKFHPVGQISDTTAGVEGLADPYCLALSPDGRFVYVGSVGDSTAVSWFSRDTVSGALMFAGWTKLTRPSWNIQAVTVTISPDGKHLYAVSGSTYIFARNALTGALTDRDSVPYTINNAQPRCSRVSADGRSLVQVSMGGSSITWMGRDTSTGALTFKKTVYHGTPGVEGLYRPISVSISPDSRHAYSVSSDSVLSVFALDTNPDSLRFMQSFKQGVSGVAGLTYSYAVETSPDGRHLYTISGTDNGFAWYTRNTSTGMLAYGGFVANDNGTVEYPWDMDISADGSAIGIYLVNKGVISLFRRDTVSGQTTFQNQSAWAFIWGDQPPIINGEGMVVFSPDGRFIYQTSRIYNRIIWFRRNHQPLLDSSAAVGDTVDLAEGDSLLFRLYARDTDAGDSLRYVWIHRGERRDTAANAFMLRTDYSSLRIDSLRAGVSDGLDTTWRSWVLRIANTGIAPQVVRPVNGDTISADTLLVWQEWSDPDLGNAIRYRLQFSTDSLFGDTLLTRDDLGVESGSLRSLQIEDSLPEGVPIYWRVKAHETQGYTYETPFSDGPTWFYYQTPSAAQRGVMAMAPARPSVAVLGNARGGHLALALSVPASTQATRQSVAVDILDFGGRIVLTPFRGGLEAGVHRVRIPAPVSGTYLVRMRIDGAVVHTVRCAVAD